MVTVEFRAIDDVHYIYKAKPESRREETKIQLSFIEPVYKNWASCNEKLKNQRVWWKLTDRVCCLFNQSTVGI